MFFKLSFKNMQKCVKDYTVYFITLTLAVSIFYTFNSIGDQQAMLNFMGEGGTKAQSLNLVMQILSVFVSVALAFLIIYANMFMMKRRKREFGIYMLMGMTQRKVSGLLVGETVLLGLLALLTGLILGFIMSQCLAPLTAFIFKTTLKDFRFVFSPTAFIMTLIGFGILFLTVTLLNAVSVSKLKLIDLFSAEKKNEKMRLSNPFAAYSCLIAGIFVIICSYEFVLRGGADAILATLGPGLLINTAGTLLFLAAFSALYVSFCQKNQKKYYTGLNMFACRQFAGKINTNFVSMGFICELLFLTIVILSTVSSYNYLLSKEFETQNAPYDASFIYKGADKSIGGVLEEADIDAGKLFETSHEYPIYQAGLKLGDFLNIPDNENNADKISASPVQMLRVSDYNKLMEMRGAQEISLKDGEFAVLSSKPPAIAQSLDNFLTGGNIVTINGRELTPYSGEIRGEPPYTSTAGYSYMMFIVPDAAAEGLTPELTVYTANYRAPKSNAEGTIANTNFSQYLSDAESLTSQTRELLLANINSSTSLMIFAGLYLGLVFLITSAAILALQQLTETSDNKYKYDLLRKLGAEENLISKALRKQMALYFILPLILAGIHSVFGIMLMHQGLEAISGIDVAVGAALCSGVIALIYGGYYLASYCGCLRIIEEIR